MQCCRVGNGEREGMPADIAAVSEIQRRMTRLRVGVMVPGALLAFVAAALAGYEWADRGFATGRNNLSLGAVTCATFTLVMALAWGAYRGLARIRVGAWLAEVGKAHGVPAAELEITAAPYIERRGAPLPYARWLVAAAVGILLALAIVSFVYSLTPR